MAEARRHVRESPDEAPLPPDLQYRLHTMMVHGRQAFQLFGEEPVEPPPAIIEEKRRSRRLRPRPRPHPPTN